ncbi:hypothetical protein DLE54_10375 [Psychrobacter sp. YP14]|uniref:hypothetical protein n=1 Tax=Psychrobacter sp. YP14 TaxID=2203895 RepID=UPI000D7E1F63|nr:hypothetical protein [Psychrobacter sp. YP14]AWT49866.1 hypothetical protein DLE54_10375 [Psychrobacter sp. YP14]
MSSQKKPSFWQRLKYLITAKSDIIKSEAETLTTAHRFSESSATPPLSQTREPTQMSNAEHQELTSAFELDQQASPERLTADVMQAQPPKRERYDYQKSRTQQPGTSDAHKMTPSGYESTSYFSDEDSIDAAAVDEAPAKFISLSNLDNADNMKMRTASFQYSQNPITDSILDFLEASDLNYYYHDPVESSEVNDSSEETADTPSGNQTQKYQGSITKRNVHHISMAMRYYNDTTGDYDVDADQSSEGQRRPGTGSTPDANEVEWGCVIRVHEHTQLVAMYGVLPFSLPETHLEAGLALATQLNYDMMLGCVEIDIRDGEIRFKNSLDLEPIINASGGIVPPTVISYLLKGVMAMTASFSPLFSDLLASNPEDFELSTILQELHKAQMDKTFFLPTRVTQ